MCKPFPAPPCTPHAASALRVAEARLVKLGSIAAAGQPVDPHTMFDADAALVWARRDWAGTKTGRQEADAALVAEGALYREARRTQQRRMPGGGDRAGWPLVGSRRLLLARWDTAAALGEIGGPVAAGLWRRWEAAVWDAEMRCYPTVVWETLVGCEVGLVAGGPAGLAADLVALSAARQVMDAGRYSAAVVAQVTDVDRLVCARVADVLGRRTPSGYLDGHARRAERWTGLAFGAPDAPAGGGGARVTQSWIGQWLRAPMLLEGLRR